MVLYLSIQLRCRSKNIQKCLSNVRHTKNGSYWFYFLIWKSYLTLSENSSFHYNQQVGHQNVTHFTLNGNQERPTMKKTSKILNMLINRANLQFKTVNLRN